MVSAIIITKDRALLLKKAIESVLQQSYKDIECIVVDDASIDNTEKVVMSYGNKVKYIRIDKKNSRGGNYARNLGIKYSSGEYLAFLDDDDVWLPEKIGLQCNAITQTPDVGLVYCGRKNIYITDDQEYEIDVFPDKGNRGNISRKIMYTIPCLTSTIFVKRSVLKEVGLFDEKMRFWQEYELLIRIAQKTNFAFINQCLVLYSCDEKSKSRLTNKYYEWLLAVDYVHKKHIYLYNDLSLFGKSMYKLLVASEAKKRSKRAGLKKNERMFILLDYYSSFILAFPFLCFRKLYKNCSILQYMEK
ncbi:MAG: glycosyltransferase [Bacteroides sp.]|jgi:glycosyltransferase involved in cell wall biosynthesis|nr:glycosyltransferase [Bacteroides sp.]MCI1682743.1 glycosyltransferase [Bacteroides sp.]